MIFKQNMRKKANIRFFLTLLFLSGYQQSQRNNNLFFLSK